MRIPLLAVLCLAVGCAGVQRRPLRKLAPEPAGSGGGWTKLPPIQLEIFGQAETSSSGGACTGCAHLTGSEVFTGGKTFSATLLGAAATFSGTVSSDLFSAKTATSATLHGTMADGASAVGVILDNTISLGTAGGHLISFRNAGVEQSYISLTGHPHADSYRAFTAVGVSLMGAVADGASAVATILDNSIALANATAKITSFRSNAVEKAYVDAAGDMVGLAFLPSATSGNVAYKPATGAKTCFSQTAADCVSSTGTSATYGTAANTFNGDVGVLGIFNANQFRVSTSGELFGNSTNPVVVNDADGLRIKPNALDTCSATYEGAFQNDTTAGLATGHRTRMCLCTSDGASAYKWQNIVTATLGTTTTCPD